MNTFFLEAVHCKHCQRLCYFQQSSSASPEDDPRWSELDAPTPLVACTQCKRVYDYRDQKPRSVPSAEGLAPVSPGATLSVFQVPIECGELNCESRITVHVVLKSDTSDEELELVKLEWKIVGVRCPDHDFRWPPGR
jgi:hypothetical protein